MEDFKFCPKCGQKLELKMVGNHQRLVCSFCQFVFYQNPKPTVGIFVINGKKVLLAKRGIEPFKGWWDSVGGFIEEGESPEEAAIREAKEETNLDIKLGEILGAGKDIYSGQHIIPIAFAAKLIGGVPQPADDVVELKWFSLDSLPRKIAFEGNKKVLQLLKQKLL